MPVSSKYLFVVSMDVDADKEELFNEIYDTEHLPNLLAVPGVRAVTRMTVLVSPEWANAVEQGRWPTQVRPFTHNRRHALYKVRYALSNASPSLSRAGA